jgi:tetratricopeptide (TPR) repeat protein
MMLLPRAFSLLLILTLQVSPTLLALSLREQLGLAEKEEDTYAQIEIIRRILDRQPDDAELREQLVDLWLSVEDYDMAESTIHEWKDAPENVRVRVLATVLFARDRKSDKAIALLQDYLDKQPEDLEIIRQLATYLLATGKEQRTFDLLTGYAQTEADADLLVSRALARGKLKDFSGALEDFAKADKLDSEEESVAKNRPSFDRLRSALPGIDAADAVLAVNHDDAAARISRAYWYLFTNFASGAALEDVEAARRIDPSSVAALILFAEAANRTGRLSANEARDKFEVNVDKPLAAPEALDRLYGDDVDVAKNAKNIFALLRRGQELSEGWQQYQLALRDAERVLAIEGANPRARAQKISALVKLRRLDDAAAELRPLEAAKPPGDMLAGALGDLVAAAAGASQLEAALDYANRAIKAKPEAQYYRQRAAIFQALELPEDAQADLFRAEQLEKGETR